MIYKVTAMKRDDKNMSEGEPSNESDVEQLQPSPIIDDLNNSLSGKCCFNSYCKKGIIW